MNRSASNHDMTTCWRRTISMAMVAAVLTVRPAAAEQITVRPQATPHSTVVRLGDVADVRAEDSRRAEKLTALPLMPAPAPGTQRYLRMREIQDLLAAHGEDIHQLQFNGQTVVEVHAPRPAQPSSMPQRVTTQVAPAVAETRPERLSRNQTRQLQQQVRDLIIEHLRTVAGENEPWQVTFKLPQQHLQLLRAATSPPACEGGATPWTGTQQFHVRLATGKGRAQFSVDAEVTLPRQVAVAIRPISRGELIKATDVEMQYTDQVPRVSGRRAPIEDVDRLVGMEATQSVQEGAVIFTDQVRLPLLVNRGEMVTVVARGGGICVRTQGRARAEGAQGDVVQIESLETRERYDAQVIGPREVAVLAGTRVRGGASTARAPRPLSEDRFARPFHESRDDGESTAPVANPPRTSAANSWARFKTAGDPWR